ncbi:MULTISPECIES: hypothetical protein [Citricoccus]|uniref:Uncharacterized protein n=1 Tax=Citricoccus muralis TaxID=169134 RepID=A0ABY8H5F5_9MICC|nr:MULTISPECIES: hypothetical protein [Citricoccus]WBL20105.1 hypothetical protein O1A05_05335 [Citricoccus sp. NR2]WFP16370.1 hypothetical protein P8192_13470 [Citricoccus muralis]
MAPQSSPEEPEETPGRLGFFAVPVELLGVVAATSAGVLTVMAPDQSTVLGIIILVIGAALLIDVSRRIWRLATGREHY